MENKKIKLEDIGTRKPFAVPENYFADFDARLETKLELQPDAQNIKAYKIIKPWMYMAAMFTGILLMASVVMNVYNKNLSAKNENYELYMLSQLDDDVIYEYYINDNNQNDTKENEDRQTEIDE
jgi:hypothetical protein